MLFKHFNNLFVTFIKTYRLKQYICINQLEQMPEYYININGERIKESLFIEQMNARIDSFSNKQEKQRVIKHYTGVLLNSTRVMICTVEELMDIYGDVLTDEEKEKIKQYSNKK